MAGYIKRLKDNENNDIYPQTKGSAVFLETGQNLEGELNKKANLNSPNFMGKPLVPTADQSSNDGQIANTAFVKKALQSSNNGIDIQISLSQPSNQKIGDFWYKILQ